MLFLTFLSIFKLLLLLKHFTGSFDDVSEAPLLKSQELAVDLLAGSCRLSSSARMNDSGVLSGSGGGELERSRFVSECGVRSFKLLLGLSLTESLDVTEGGTLLCSEEVPVFSCLAGS